MDTTSEFRGSRFGNAKSRLKSQPLNQDQIWTVDSSQWRGIGDRELDMSKKIDIRNPDIAIGEIAI
jgi:hypothetical protein